MRTSIQKWGNSLGVRLPVKILEDVSLQAGDEVEIRAKENEVTISPTGNTSIATLFSKITEENRHSHADFGEPLGKEVW